MCMRVGLSHTKNGLSSLLALSMKLIDEVANLVIHGLHALGIERSGVLDLLFADFAPTRHVGRIIRGRSPSNEPCCAGQPHSRDSADNWDAPGLPSHRGDTDSQKFVEAVNAGQKLILVAQVILAKLPRRIAHRFQDRGNGHCFGGQCRSRRLLGLPWSCPYESAVRR